MKRDLIGKDAWLSEHEDAYAEGHSDGYADGHDDGHAEGYETGLNEQVWDVEELLANVDFYDRQDWFDRLKAEAARLGVRV